MTTPLDDAVAKFKPGIQVTIHPSIYRLLPPLWTANVPSDLRPVVVDVQGFHGDPDDPMVCVCLPREDRPICAWVPADKLIAIKVVGA